MRRRPCNALVTSLVLWAVEGYACGSFMDGEKCGCWWGFEWKWTGGGLHVKALKRVLVLLVEEKDLLPNTSVSSKTWQSGEAV